jgi:hypothetical protein
VRNVQPLGNAVSLCSLARSWGSEQHDSHDINPCSQPLTADRFGRATAGVLTAAVIRDLTGDPETGCRAALCG